jgi:hypothetical protein
MTIARSVPTTGSDTGVAIWLTCHASRDKKHDGDIYCEIKSEDVIQESGN